MWWNFLARYMRRRGRVTPIDSDWWSLFSVLHSYQTLTWGQEYVSEVLCVPRLESQAYICITNGWSVKRAQRGTHITIRTTTEVIYLASRIHTKSNKQILPWGQEYVSEVLGVLRLCNYKWLQAIQMYFQFFPWKRGVTDVKSLKNRAKLMQDLQFSHEYFKYFKRN
jgi:hypothetical protein